MKTFLRDKFIRDEKDIPIGRCVIIDDSVYVEGESLPIVLVKIPVNYYSANDHIYIDGTAYRIPKDASPVRKSTDGINIILNSVTLEVTGK